MSATIKRFFVLFIVSAMLIGGSTIMVRAQDADGSLGNEIASTFHGLLEQHRGNITRFILDTKVSVASTTEARLDVIDEYINGTLRVKVEEVKLEREDLIAAVQAGDIDNETLGMEMQRLALELADTAKTMGEIGGILHELGEDLAGDLKTRAEGLVAVNRQLAEDMAAAGKGIAEEMAGRGLPIPGGLPIPDEGPPEGVPDGAADGTPEGEPGPPEGVPPEGVPEEQGAAEGTPEGPPGE